VVDVAGAQWFQWSATGEYSSLDWSGDIGGYYFNINANGISTNGRQAGYFYSNGSTTIENNPYNGILSYQWGSTEDLWGGGGLMINLGPGGQSWDLVGEQNDGTTTAVTTSQSSSSSTTANGTTISQQVTTSDSTSSTVQTLTIGNVVIGTNTNINTNTNYNTNTNTEYDYTDNINTNTNTNYNTITTYTPEYQLVYNVNESWTVSPIVLDLSGTGKLDASGGHWLPHKGRKIQGNVVSFDMNANGLEVFTEWVGPTAGLLVEPRADGTVDGSCLFGTTGGFVNGFEKLKARDANNDGTLSGAELNGLMVWVDTNGNGKVDAGELHTLASLHITSLSVNHHNFKGTYTANGKTCAMWDWWPTALDVREVRRIARTK